MGRAPLLLCTLLLLPLLGSAREILPDANRIDSVTVFLDRAEVTRRVELTLPAGEHTLLIEQLPAQLLEASLRASGSGPAGLRIATVESRRVYGEQVAAEQERKLRSQLQALKDEKAQLAGRAGALDTQAKFIEQLATLPNEQDKNGNRLFTPEKWATAWQAIGKGMTQTNEARITLQQQQRQLEERIRKVEQELRQIQTGRRDTITAAIQLAAEKAGEATFELSYQLGGASWSPLYDAALATESGELQLTQAAVVRQGTGEDWEGAQLTVSTARPSAGAAMPELHPWWIDFQRPRPLRESRAKSMVADEMLAGAMAPQAEPAEAEEISAVAQASEFSLRYRIPGRVSVPADNSKHRFVLHQQRLGVALSARSAPRFDRRAFLYAELDYAGENPLLPGPWHLQRDGSYVGTQHNEALRPGQHISLAFGADEAIEVAYRQLKDERARQGLINREQRLERRYRIEATNHHQRPLPVTLFDQIPVARDEAIKVTLLEEGTAPSEQDVDDRPGVLAWEATLKPQQKQTIDFGYAVSYPLDRKVPGF
jgi:uncharacterized protein (TIGR02231 family)